MPKTHAIKSDYPASSMEYKREYNRLYRLEHPETGRIASAKYRVANLEKVRECARDYAKRNRLTHPNETHTRDRKLALSKNYGITEDEYNDLFEKQSGLCAACGSSETSLKGYLCVDHDHKTGKIRGLLCRRCNVALGLVNDNTTILIKMIDYLTPNEAALAYDAAARKLFGEFASFNVPEKQEV
jgi:hypothetical protein